MNRDGKRLAKAAAQLVGVPFRLHGRDPATGLDCIGLVAASLEAIGRIPATPRGYRLRNSSITPWLGFAAMSGLETVSDGPIDGDILLVRPGPGQAHLIIAETMRSAIHAHAGLGRVVRQPLETPMKPEIIWRMLPLTKDN